MQCRYPVPADRHPVRYTCRAQNLCLQSGSIEQAAENLYSSEKYIVEQVRKWYIYIYKRGIEKSYSRVAEDRIQGG